MQKELKILLVDDDRIIQLIHKSMLNKIRPDLDLHLCFDGTEVLSFLEMQTEATQSYLILLDINMPKMNAWELLTTLETQYPNVDYSVVIVTSSVDFDDQEKAKKFCKVISFLIKPVAKSTFERLFSND
jgi:response regulator of citrate/malate metabolism